MAMTEEEEREMWRRFWEAARPGMERRIEEENQRIEEREKRKKERAEKVARGELVYDSRAHRCRCCNSWMYTHEYCGPDNRCENPNAELCSDCVHDGCM